MLPRLFAQQLRAEVVQTHISNCSSAVVCVVIDTQLRPTGMFVFNMLTTVAQTQCISIVFAGAEFSAGGVTKRVLGENMAHTLAAG